MSTARHHNEWLSLIEQTGPFLSVPVLLEADVFPQGLEAISTETAKLLRSAYDQWLDQPTKLHNAWVKFVLTEVLGFKDEVLRSDQSIPQNLFVPVKEHGETLSPTWAVVNPDNKPNSGQPRLLISMVTSDQPLDKPVRGSLWNASPETRMIELLHGADVRLGLVTNGEAWSLVHAPRGETSGIATWQADLWLEERITLDAFQSLLSHRRFFGVGPDSTLERLYERSAANQQEVTDQLGLQVRHAVEIFVRTIDRLDQDHGRELLSHVSEKRIYEAALTVMMRLVFLLSAEERKLLPIEDTLYERHYSVSSLRDHLRELADRHGEEILERRHDAWVRILSTFRVVHGGVRHDRLNLPGYGGGLFDPDRFPFLEGRKPDTYWRETQAAPVPIDNRTVLHLLEALQILQVKVKGGGPAEARRLSFRSLDIEQIGHIYEGLLDHTAIRALPSEPVLGLAGTKGNEPEIELSRLESLRDQSDEKLLDFLKDETGRGLSALQNSSTKAAAGKTRKKKKTVSVDDFMGDMADAPIAWPPEDHHHENRLMAACGGDKGLFERIRPFAGLIRTDTFGHPMIIPGSAIYVTQGTDRRATGTHYTPRNLTEPIVQYTLEPLVYWGPSLGLGKEHWRLLTPKEILSLKVCDMAMGSGAFLVQACRYLSERLVEAWELEEQQTGQPVTYPEADPSTGQITERILGKDVEERLALARRAVAERCLYGVDKNPLATEIAKLSLWLITLDKSRPFTFLDHALKAGDSLLGIHDPKQLQNFHLDPETGASLNYDFIHSSRVEVIKNRIKEASRLRQRLESFVVNSTRDAEEKARLLQEADKATSVLRLLGDLLVGAQLQVNRRDYGGNYDELIQDWLTGHVYEAVDDAFEDVVRQKHIAALEGIAHKALDGTNRDEPRDTFHWAVEFPEVFEKKPHGFDAIIGNPPFQGGQKITGELGTDYRDYLVERLARGQRGSADLCAYFFLRAQSILRPGGHAGLIATNTIAQGDTREVGLDQLCAIQSLPTEHRDGDIFPEAVIYRATSSRKWPGVANLEISEVWWRKREDFYFSEEDMGRLQQMLDNKSPYLGEMNTEALIKPFQRISEGLQKQMNLVLGAGGEFRKAMGTIKPELVEQLHLSMRPIEMQLRKNMAAAMGPIRQQVSANLEAVLRPVIEEFGKPDGAMDKMFHKLSAGFRAKGLATPPVLDGRPVLGITPFLSAPSRVTGNPYRLRANEGKSYIGSYVLGMGFVLEPEQAQELINADPRNKDVLFPYLIGSDRNDHPEQHPSRWVINFHDWPLERRANGAWTTATDAEKKIWLRTGFVPPDYPDPVARDFSDCLKIVETLVKPARMKQKDKYGKKFWWRFLRERQELYAKAAEKSKIIAVTQTSWTQSPTYVPHGVVYGHKLVLFPDDSALLFGLLASTIHFEWVLKYGSSMRTDPVYTPSDCFETFPMPAWTDRTASQMTAAAEEYNRYRAELMKHRCEGLTRTYNRFHDPAACDTEISELRRLHELLDRALLTAYNWNIELDYGFHERPYGTRYTFSERARVEILDSLLELNHTRYSEEVKAGLHNNGKKAKSTTGKKSKAKKTTTPGDDLIGDLDNGPEHLTTNAVAQAENTTTKVGPTGTSPSVEESKKATATLEKPTTWFGTPTDEFTTEDCMAAMRKALRNRGAISRRELLELTRDELGRKKLSQKLEKRLKNAIRAAIARGIVQVDELDRDTVFACTRRFADYTREQLRYYLIHRLRQDGSVYTDDEVIDSVAIYLGFSHVKKEMRDELQSVITGALRMGLIYRDNAGNLRR